MKSETISGLSKLSDQEIIERHDKLSKNTVVGTKHYRQELHRRYQERQTTAMLRYTKLMLVLTTIIALLTIINLIVFYTENS